MIRETHIPHPAATTRWPSCLWSWKLTILDLIQQSLENITRYVQKFPETGETPQPLKYGRNANSSRTGLAKKSLSMFKSVLKQEKQQNPLNTVARSFLKGFYNWQKALLIFVFVGKGLLSKRQIKRKWKLKVKVKMKIWKLNWKLKVEG